MPTTDDLKQRLSDAAQQASGEFVMALLVSEVIDSEVDSENLRQLFADLLTPIAGLEAMEVEQLLDFFRDCGFATQGPQPADLSHSNLQWVIAQRQGLPIAVAALLIEAARRYGIVAHGINYPGHFLVSLDQQLVDPLSLRAVQLQQLEAKLTAQQQQDVMTPTLTSVFGLRMLNNVKIQYARAQNWVEVLDILECQLVVETVDPVAQAALQFERGECLLQMQRPVDAQRAYVSCLEMSPPPVLAQQVEARLSQLQLQPKILH